MGIGWPPRGIYPRKSDDAGNAYPVIVVREVSQVEEESSECSWFHVWDLSTEYFKGLFLHSFVALLRTLPTYIYISFLFVPFFINCWFFCPLLRFERRRRTSPGIRISGFGADGGSRRYQARQDIQMLWTVKVWEGSTGCDKHPPP